MSSTSHALLNVRRCVGVDVGYDGLGVAMLSTFYNTSSENTSSHSPSNSLLYPMIIEFLDNLAFTKSEEPPSFKTLHDYYSAWTDADVQQYMATLNQPHQHHSTLRTNHMMEVSDLLSKGSTPSVTYQASISKRNTYTIDEDDEDLLFLNACTADEPGIIRTSSCLVDNDNVSLVSPLNVSIDSITSQTNHDNDDNNQSIQPKKLKRSDIEKQKSLANRERMTRIRGRFGEYAPSWVQFTASFPEQIKPRKQTKPKKRISTKKKNATTIVSLDDLMQHEPLNRQKNILDCNEIDKNAILISDDDDEDDYEEDQDNWFDMALLTSHNHAFPLNDINCQKKDPKHSLSHDSFHQDNDNGDLPGVEKKKKKSVLAAARIYEQCRANFMVLICFLYGMRGVPSKDRPLRMCDCLQCPPIDLSFQTHYTLEPDFILFHRNRKIDAWIIEQQLGYVDKHATIQSVLFACFHTMLNVFCQAHFPIDFQPKIITQTGSQKLKIQWNENVVKEKVNMVQPSKHASDGPSKDTILFKPCVETVTLMDQSFSRMTPGLASSSSSTTLSTLSTSSYVSPHTTSSYVSPHTRSPYENSLSSITTKLSTPNSTHFQSHSSKGSELHQARLRALNAFGASSFYSTTFTDPLDFMIPKSVLQHQNLQSKKKSTKLTLPLYWSFSLDDRIVCYVKKPPSQPLLPTATTTNNITTTNTNTSIDTNSTPTTKSSTSVSSLTIENQSLMENVKSKGKKNNYFAKKHGYYHASKSSKSSKPSTSNKAHTDSILIDDQHGAQNNTHPMDPLPKQSSDKASLLNDAARLANKKQMDYTCHQILLQSHGVLGEKWKDRWIHEKNQAMRFDPSDALGHCLYYMAQYNMPAEVIQLRKDTSIASTYQSTQLQPHPTSTLSSKNTQHQHEPKNTKKRKYSTSHNSNELLGLTKKRKSKD